ncbi:MAG: glucose sorbosone dehydrogenase [Chloroflexi bacterium RBG_16_56_11]|nr:MAG: glucose sorbosone dehydrogenase [Chloroflexi bacterium RBG_16_56_11]
MIKRIVLLTVLGILVVAILLIWWNFRAGRTPALPTVPPTTSTQTAPSATQTPAGGPLAVALATRLEVPWALDFLPGGAIIFTERPGRVRLIDAGRRLLPEPLLVVRDVAATGEGGLLGIAVHPDFSRNNLVYLYYTYQDGGSLFNRVARYIWRGSSLVNDRVIIDGIPAGSVHDGGRIKFGPDGYLYITCGDAGNAAAAQDISALNGKILRLEDDGGVPADNPFPGSPVYSYGHRNPEGLAWDDRGRLWATEHGSSATDELNLVESGKNYGWPVIRGDETAAGMVTPVINSGAETWAPSGAAYFNGSIFFTGLRGQSLFEVPVGGAGVTLKRHFDRDFGRLREVVIGPDGFFYLLTSNRDGRGLPVDEDDQVIRLDPARLD